MRSHTKRLLLLVALVAAGMPAAVTAGSETVAGTLSMNASLALRHGDVNPSSDCETRLGGDECAARTIQGPFPGLGQVNGRYDFPMDEGAPACAGGDARALAYPIRLTVAGKGDIDVAVAQALCVPLQDVVNQTQTFTVVGGTGSYAGASGSGTLVHSLSELTAQGRFGRETWTGTFEVPGLEFDVTRPTLTGATNKTVKARKGAKSARVAFRVTAQDDRDGALPVSCSPRPGSAFRIGRTRVTCDASDLSANTATASFAVTVQRRR